MVMSGSNQAYHTPFMGQELRDGWGELRGGAALREHKKKGSREGGKALHMRKLQMLLRQSDLVTGPKLVTEMPSQPHCGPPVPVDACLSYQ
jgi:hypothetical protein